MYSFWKAERRISFLYSSEEYNQSFKYPYNNVYFFKNNNLSWVNLCGICIDGAPEMIGSRSGFQALVKHRAPAVKGVHCMIHRQALASKTSPESLSYVLQQSINLVNYIKSSALNTRLFKKLCKETEAEHNVLFHTRVRWLSKGSKTARVF